MKAALPSTAQRNEHHGACRQTNQQTSGRQAQAGPAAQAGQPARKATKTAKPTKAAAAPKRGAAATAPAPKLNVAELRAQVEKLERSLATLRTKNREANRAAKTDTVRIAELEQQVGQLAAKAAAPTPAAKRAPKPDPVPASRTKRQSRGADPADAALPASETEAARESPEHLGDA